MGSPTPPQEHVVQSGQTLAKIAKRYHVELDALCAANGLRKSAKLQPGLRLTLPSDEAQTEAVPQKQASSSIELRPRSAKRPDSARRPGATSSSYGQYLARPAKRGWVHVMGHHGDWQGQLVGKNGKLQPKAVVSLSRLLAWPRTDLPMDRRLLTLLAQVSDAFGGRTLRVVSGYRTTSYSAESKHPLGRACDFHVLGVPNTALRDFVRTFDDVGVGYYPNSTFIHLDARDHDAYWIDYAGPGEPPRSTPHRVVTRISDPPPLTLDRAAVNMQDHDAPVVSNPEADADAEARQGEVQVSKPAAPTAPVAAKPKRSLGSAPQRGVIRAGVAAEAESTEGPRLDIARRQVDF